MSGEQKAWHQRLDELLARRDHGAVKKLAIELGKDPSQVSHYRAGRRAPDVDELVIICREFGVSADWLLGLDDSKAPPGPLNDLQVGELAALLQRAQDLIRAAELERVASVHGHAAGAVQQTASSSSSSQTSGKGRGRRSDG